MFVELEPVLLAPGETAHDLTARVRAYGVQHRFELHVFGFLRGIQGSLRVRDFGRAFFA